jgi:predicted amidohydrolase YtcJ
MPERLLLHGGYVLSMDDTIGDVSADVLVDDGEITAVAPDLEVSDVERVDVTGDVVMPGFVDTLTRGTPAEKPSRRPDSNRGPLHYE